jgi:hypothetical protein
VFSKNVFRMAAQTIRLRFGRPRQRQAHTTSEQQNEDEAG